MNSWCLRSRLNDAIIIGQVTPPAIQQARDGCCGFARAAAARQQQSSFVFSPHGRQLAFLPVPETPTNCVFGDKDRKTLYVTAGKSLYRIRLGVRGFAVFWPK